MFLLVWFLLAFVLAKHATLMGLLGMLKEGEKKLSHFFIEPAFRSLYFWNAIESLSLRSSSSVISISFSDWQHSLRRPQGRESHFSVNYLLKLRRKKVKTRDITDSRALSA